MKKDSFVIPVLLVIFYGLYLYFAYNFLYSNSLLISNNSISVIDIVRKLIIDFLLMLLLPVILLIIYRKNLSIFNLRLIHIRLQVILISIILILFILHADFDIDGFYSLFFYLVVVSFGEEFLFRGYLYNKLKKYNILIAIIISGLLWGVFHAIIPSILDNRNIINIGSSMLNYVGGGIVTGYYFIYLQEKSKSLYVPILVHAILDYTIGFIGIATAVSVFIFLLINDKRLKSGNKSVDISD